MEVVCPHIEDPHRGKTGSTNTTPVGFEPTRGDPIGLAGRCLSRSAKVSWMLRGEARFSTFGVEKKFWAVDFQLAGAREGGQQVVLMRWCAHQHLVGPTQIAANSEARSEHAEVCAR